MQTAEYDFDEMQEDAIRQAREMFRRASPQMPDIEFEKNEEPLKFHNHDGTVREAHHHSGFNSVGIRPQNKFGGMIRDKDIALLLALILLLSYDGGDRLLILALVYIMS